MTSGLLKKFVSLAPSSSGIYIFKDSKRKLYIGKAANLKARLRSYLKTNGPRIKEMVSAANDLAFKITESDIEALILESQLIKKFCPRFNIVMRDDKQYFYVGFGNENFPKIFITHQPNPKYRNIEISSSIGPFTDGTALKTTLRYLRRIFPYCTCKQTHYNYCLNYHIEKCLGFCCLKENQNPVRPDQSKEFGSDQETKNLRLVAKQNDRFVLQLLKYKNVYKKNIKAVKDILSGKKNLLLKNLEKEMTVFGKKGEFKKAIELREQIEKIKRVFENARIIQNSSYYDTSKNHSESVLSDLRTTFGLKTTPNRIEGYDVANIQGKYAVGAMTVFTLRQDSGQINWKPDKNEYRKFKIHAKQTPDDTAMLKEILIRRFRHPEWPMPDLVLVDGGKQQLCAAEAVVNSKSQITKHKQIPIIALAKNEKHRGEKIYIDRRKDAISLLKLPVNVKNLLLQIDSEAHRFTISYYRKLHRKKALRPY